MSDQNTIRKATLAYARLVFGDTNGLFTEVLRDLALLGGLPNLGTDTDA
jgi:hypothetical protein